MSDAEEWGPLTGVKLVVVDREGQVVSEVEGRGWGAQQNRQRFTNILQSFVEGLEGSTESPVMFISTVSQTSTTQTANHVVPRKDLVG